MPFLNKKLYPINTLKNFAVAFNFCGRLWSIVVFCGRFDYKKRVAYKKI
jgi:hypothetical protein